MKSKEFQGLHNLIAPRGAMKNRKRLGRGESSGHGKTAGRGNKGQKARKSGMVRIGFEGGQAEFMRRVPKRGFSNFDFRRDFEVVNLSRLSERFESGATVDASSLVAAGLLRNTRGQVKVLGTGELSHALHLKVHAVSKSAQTKIESKGGSVQIIGKA